MNDLPPFLERLLTHLGLSTTQIRWRYRRKRDLVAGRLGALRQPRARHTFCRHCGHVAAAGDAKCPGCGKSLPSWWASRIYRSLALSGAGGWVSVAFISVIAALFCLQLGLTGFQGLLSPSGQALRVFGAFATALWERGELWRLLSMGLMHIGIIHLVFNLMALSQTLGAFEEEIGSWPTLVLITLTQVGAAAAHMLVYDPRVLTAGASGIAFGLIGFGVAYFHRKGNPAQRRFFLQWAGYGLVFGLLAGANNAAHAGGFLTGLPLGWLAAGMRIRHQGFWRVAGILCLAAWLACLGFLAVNVARNRETLRMPEQAEQG